MNRDRPAENHIDRGKWILQTPDSRERDENGEKKKKEKKRMKKKPGRINGEDEARERRGESPVPSVRFSPTFDPIGSNVVQAFRESRSSINAIKKRDSRFSRLQLSW